MKVEKNTVLRERQIALWLRQQREGKTSDALEDRAVEGWYSEDGPLDKSGEGHQWSLWKMKNRCLIKIIHMCFIASYLLQMRPSFVNYISIMLQGVKWVWIIVVCFYLKSQRLVSFFFPRITHQPRSWSTMNSIVWEICPDGCDRKWQGQRLDSVSKWRVEMTDQSISWPWLSKTTLNSR